MRRECATIGLQFFGCIAPQYQDIGERRREMRAHEAKVLLLGEEQNRPPRPKRYEAGSLEHEQSTQDIGIDERDLALLKSRTVRDETGVTGG